MNNRLIEIVLEADPEIVFDINKDESKIIIRASLYKEPYEGYKEPPIPEGFEHVSGTWDTGFVIERISDRSSFIWVPVGALPANARIHGHNYTEKFGIRTKYKDESYATKVSDPIGIIDQRESVKKYGGFYISRYKISFGEKEKYQSIEEGNPITWIPYEQAKSKAEYMVRGKNVKSHLVYGAEYDAEFTWADTPEKKKLYSDGGSPEWTQFENTEKQKAVMRIYDSEIDETFEDPGYRIRGVGFRVALWIK